MTMTIPKQVSLSELLHHSNKRTLNRELEYMERISASLHVPSQYGATLNCRRAASLLMRLVEGEERWTLTTPQGAQNWGENEPKLFCHQYRAQSYD
ncbi:hypothetical protein TNCV_1782261 [Trichonephila clavipes]|nr:hypothetical protein TNCV_1782261 [Trichonephila clavipes]